MKLPAAPEKLDKRRARGDATRTQVLDAAANLFAAQGYSATSITAIGEASGVRSASIYHSFGSKEGLLAAVVARASDAFYAELAQPAGLEELMELIQSLAGAFEEGPDFVRLMLLLALERRDGDPAIIASAVAVRARARDIVAQALEQDLPELSPQRRERVLDDIGRLMLMLLDGAAIAGQVDPDADLAHLFELVTAALRGMFARLATDAT